MKAANGLIHSDEMLNHWGDVYVALGLDELLGITFEQFLCGPRFYLIQARGRVALKILAQLRFEAAGGEAFAEAAADRIGRTGFAGLLPFQRVLADRIEAEELVAEQRRIEADSMTAALRRVEWGMSTAGDAELIERALSQSTTGRRMLAQRNGRYFEALHHHRHPVSNPDFASHGGAA